MKSLKLFTPFILLLAAQDIWAQQTHLKLSDDHPARDEKVTVTYDTTGTPLAGKSPLGATVFYFKGTSQPSCVNIDLAATQNKDFKGTFIVPKNARAFFIKPIVKEESAIMPHMEKQFDANKRKGYIYMVYDHGTPVMGAYAALAEIYIGSGRLWYQINTDFPGAFADLQKDINRYPELKAGYYNNYYWLYTRVMREKNKAAVTATIDSLAANTNECDNMVAITLYRMSGDTAKATAMQMHINTAYPNGEQAKMDALTAMRKQRDADKRLQLFADYRKRFSSLYPAEKENFLMCDFVLESVADAYARSGQYTVAENLADSIRNGNAKAETYSNIAGKMTDAKQDAGQIAVLLAKSDALYRRILPDQDNNDFFTETNDEYQARIRHLLDANNDQRAMELYNQGEIAKALKLEKPVYDQLNKTYFDVDSHYATLLIAAGQPEKAMDVLAAVVKTGRAGDEQKTGLKKAYIAAHKSDQGYDDYLAGLNKDVRTMAKEKIAKTMIDKPAPHFMLKDLDGKQVSLAELKGKVVVVDFWATWCGPCKASFPGMQLAVTQYKDNPGVKFVFIDTWEKNSPGTYIADVKKFIADNHYTFHVLEDEADTTGKQQKIVSSFDVDAIPTKFIIDKNGHIRFRVTGLTGNPQTIADEVSDMIELAAGQ